MNYGSILLADTAATHQLGVALSRLLRVGDVMALSGPLGSGKTSFARGVLAGLGLAGEAPSPSFAIVLTYDPPEVRLPIAHIDLYRLDDANDLIELGLDDLTIEGALLVEWPDRAGEGAWQDALRLELTSDGSGRRLTWSAPAAWAGRWPPSLR